MANILTGVVGFEVAGLPQLDKAGKSVDVLNNKLKATKNAGFAFNQILREAPAFAFSFNTGLIGISNNLPIFTDAIQRARESGAGFGTIIKSLAGSLFSLPSILSIGILALTQFGGTSKKTSEDTKELSEEAKKAIETQQRFNESVKAAAQSLISQASSLKDVRDLLVTTTGKMEDLTDATIKQGVARLIFSEKENAIQKALSAEIEREFLLRSRMGGLKGPDFFVDKQLENLEKVYQTNLKLGRNDTGLKQTIERIKELNNIRGEQGGVLRFLNSISGDLQKQFQSFIKIDKVTVKPDKVEVDPTLSRYDLLEVPDKDFSIDTTKIKLFNSTFLNDFKTQNDALLKPIREQLLKLRDLGVLVGNSIADGFSNAFSAIAKGESPIKALGEALKALVLDLIQAVIRAFVVKQIVNLFAPGLGGIANGGALSGLFEGFRAGGGPVAAGKGYVVGENGPEYFQPGTSGSIIPNGRLSTMSGGGFAGRVVFEISGNKLIGVLANGNRSQGALI